MASNALIPADEQCGRSFLVERKFSYKWLIHNFNSKFSTKPKILYSPTFEFNCENELKLSCQLGLTGLLNNKYTKCIFTIESVTEDYWAGLIKLSLLDQKDNAHNFLESKISNTFKQDDGNIIPLYLPTNSQQYSKFISILRDDDLTILCELSALMQKAISFPLPNCDMKKLDMCSYTSDLFGSQRYSDINFIDKRNTGLFLYAHKCILASRSKYFERMFSENLTSSKDTATIDDFDVFKEIVRYIYTGDVILPTRSDLSVKLLASCAKYDVEDLKYFYERKLLKFITIEDVADTLIIADAAKLKDLKKCAMAFIHYHTKDVTKTDGWQRIMREHQHLTGELYLDIMK